MNDAVRTLFAGNDRHVEKAVGNLDSLQDSQHPEVVTVCCGDSRVLQDGMWDNLRPGRVFTHSNIGNRVFQETERGRMTSGDVLYPLTHTDTHTAIVVGHTGCGAITAAYRDLTEGIDELEGIHHCVRLLESHLESGVELLSDGLPDGDAINHLVEYNVDGQVDHLVGSADVPDSVTVLGVVYDFHDVYSERRGKIHLVNCNGVRDPQTLREQYPSVADRVDRLLEY